MAERPITTEITPHIFMQSSQMDEVMPGVYSGNRDIGAEEYSQIMRQVLGDGIFPTGSDHHLVTSNGLMSIKVKSGYACIRGMYTWIKDDHTFTIDPADPLVDRTDIIVLRQDLNEAVLNTQIYYKPNTTTLTRTSSVYELGLATILVRKGVTQITQSNITDRRLDSAFCGVSKFDLQSINLDSIALQANTIVTEAETQVKQNIDLSRILLDNLQNETFILINNDYDDWSVKTGCDYLTTFNADGSITETLKIKSSGFLLATRDTTFPTDSKIEETVKFYNSEAVINGNTVKTIASENKKTTTFNTNGTILEEIRGI